MENTQTAQTAQTVKEILGTQANNINEAIIDTVSDSKEIALCISKVTQMNFDISLKLREREMNLMSKINKLLEENKKLKEQASIDSWTKKSR